MVFTFWSSLYCLAPEYFYLPPTQPLCPGAWAPGAHDWMSSATPLCALGLTTSLYAFHILLLCPCLNKPRASCKQFCFPPVPSPILSGQKTPPAPNAHPDVTDPSQCLPLASHADDPPQLSASAFAQSFLLCRRLNPAENRGKASVLSRRFQRSFFCPKGRSRKEFPGNLFHAPSNQTELYTPGWLDWCANQETGDFPSWERQPVRWRRCNFCVWMTRGLRWMVLGSLQSSNTSQRPTGRQALREVGDLKSLLLMGTYLVSGTLHRSFLTLPVTLKGSSCPPLTKEKTEVKWFSQDRAPTKIKSKIHTQFSLSPKLHILPKQHVVTLLTHSVMHSFLRTHSWEHAASLGFCSVPRAQVLHRELEGRFGGAQWEALLGLRRLSFMCDIKESG